LGESCSGIPEPTAQSEKAKGTVRTAPPVEGGDRGNPVPDAFSAIDCTTDVIEVAMADYEGVLSDLKAKRAALETERATLDGVIAGLERLVPSSNGKSRESALVEARVPARSFSGLSMPQAVAKCLKLAQQPQTKRQLVELLKAGGVRTHQHLGTHVYNTLHRLSKSDGMFRRESDGRWGLREWSDVVHESPGSPTGGTATH
jgi:hypothetical protein